MTNLSLTLALDFFCLRKRGYAAKDAVSVVASFHDVSKMRVMYAYELYELEASYGRR